MINTDTARDLTSPDPAALRAMQLAVGAAVRETRIRRGWNLHELAVCTGVSAPVISRLERGVRYPQWEALIKICWALGIRTSLLFRRAEAEAFPLDQARGTEVRDAASFRSL